MARPPGAKYGSLSERERRRLLSADVERAYKMQNRLQILTGWMQKPMDDTVLAEIGAGGPTAYSSFSALRCGEEVVAYCGRMGFLPHAGRSP